MRSLPRTVQDLNPAIGPSDAIGQNLVRLGFDEVWAMLTESEREA